MDNRRGITLMVLAMAAFAVEDSFIKVVSIRLPPGQILATIGVPGLIFYAILLRRSGQPFVTRDALDRMALVRLGAEMVGAVLFVTALAMIPLATASAILQALPLGMTAGAALILAEPVGWRRWSAVTVGFLGVLMIVRPGAEGFAAGSLIAVISVVAFAVRDLCTRLVPSRISSLQLSAWVYVGLIPTGVLVDLAAGKPWAWPGPAHGSALLGASVFGILGYWAVTESVRVGEVSLVAPFRYARLIFALIIAVLLLGERPDVWTLAGAAVIILTGLYTLSRERLVRRTPRPIATPPGTDPTP